MKTLLHTCITNIGLVLMAGAAIAQQPLQMTVVPVSPKNHQPVRIEVATAAVPAFDPLLTSVTMQNNKVIVSLKPGATTAVSDKFDVVLGRFPVGEYAVELRHEATGELGQRQFSVVPAGSTAQAPFGYPDHTAFWWNPATPSRSFFLQSDDGYVYGGLLTYAANQPTWYSLEPGYWIAPSAYFVNIDAVGGPGAAGPRRPAGWGLFIFTSHDNTQFRYMLDGELGCTNLRRFAVGPDAMLPLPACTF